MCEVFSALQTLVPDLFTMILLYKFDFILLEMYFLNLILDIRKKFEVSRQSILMQAGIFFFNLHELTLRHNISIMEYLYYFFNVYVYIPTSDMKNNNYFKSTEYISIIKQKIFPLSLA